MRKTLGRIAGIAVLLSALAVAAPSRAADGGVNLNTATQEELVTLPGVGPAKAKAIIDYRNAHPFKSVEEVKNVRGIGDHLYESLKGKVSVGPVASSGAGDRH
ncbi:MAG: helix-hairpin-helix domain-containing protein [Deltaproteobacteria bacterium]|nr:helix-hairpin-helix domain-containing protein [Deltaproteobacteria bacterium]